jgi:Fic family protein
VDWKLELPRPGSQAGAWEPATSKRRWRVSICCIMNKLSELTLRQREALFRQLRISITHHSNAIEGTTLSYGETKELLELGHTAGHKPIGEQLVILGFAKAYDVVIREASNKERLLDSSFVKDIHAIVFEDALQVTPEYVSRPVGAYRTDERRIKGVSIKLSVPNRIASDIDNLLYRMPSNHMSLSDIAEFHISFETIHPFADGNGRVGRLLMAYQSIQNDIVPPLIKNDDRETYLQVLNDKKALSDFLAESIAKSLELITN